MMMMMTKDLIKISGNKIVLNVWIKINSIGLIAIQKTILLLLLFQF